MRFAKLTACLLLAAVALAAATHNAQARGKHITNISDKHKLIDSRRPAAKVVGAAERSLRELPPEKLAILNAQRMLARPDVRLAEDPFVHGRLDLPPLGTLESNIENLPDTWVMLRLLALLKSGYPGEGGLNNEVYHWLACLKPTAGHEWADVSLELLTLDALCRRDDAILSVFHEQANQRARAIVSSRTWSLAVTPEPGSVSIANQLHFLLARKCALANGWAAEIDASIVSALIKQHDADITAQEDPKRLWAAASREIDSEHFRNVLLIAAILGIASADEALPRSERNNAGRVLRRLATRLPKDAASRDGWRCFNGDAIALMLAAGEDFCPAHVSKSAATLALSPGRLLFALPRPHNSHVAAGLRWLLCRSLGDKGMGRDAVSLEDRDLVAATCMALIGSSGGLTGAGLPAMPWAETSVLYSSLEVLDLNDYYGYMVQTDLAIESASSWLLKQQEPDGKFFGIYRNVLGGHALAVHALLDAGVSRDNKALERAWKEFVSMVERDLPNAARGDQPGLPGGGPHNYSMSIALMTFQSYYEHEIRESGMYEATTFEAYHEARARLWPKIKPRDQKLIAEISWRLSNADGFGWSYQLPEPKSPIPSPITTPPGKGDANPTTGETADARNRPREIIEELARRKREGKFPKRPEAPEQGVRHADNSNSQYSVLGIKAGMTLGAPIDFNTLAWEAERLIENFLTIGHAERPVDPSVNLTLDKLEKRRDDGYAPDDPNYLRRRARLQPYKIGGWAYYAGGAQTWGARENAVTGEDEDGYPTYRWPYTVAMTAAGISSLAIIRDALLVSPIYDPELIGRIDDRIAGGVFGLGLKYPYSRDYFKLDVKQTESWIGGGEGHGMLYDMYSCERAGVLTRQVYFGRVEWYRDGADLLMKEQAKDGSWKAIDKHLCNTSWAILFLKRSAPYLATQQPRPKGPTTGK